VSSRDPDFVGLTRSEALGGIDLLEARFVNRSTHLHFHLEVEVGVVLFGRRLVHWRSRRYEAGPGSIVVFSPGETHAGATLDRQDSAYCAFLIPETIWRQVIEWREELHGCTRLTFDTPVFSEPELADALVEAHDRLPTAADPDEVGRQVVSSLKELCRRHGRGTGGGPVGESRREHDAVVQARCFIEEHYREKIRLEKLATMTGLSVCHLIRVFRLATGLPPYAYLEQVRVQKASELLRAGRPVSQVAFETGFADQSHLTRLFRRLIGLPPGRFQRSARS